MQIATRENCYHGKIKVNENEVNIEKNNLGKGVLICRFDRDEKVILGYFD